MAQGQGFYSRSHSDLRALFERTRKYLVERQAGAHEESRQFRQEGSVMAEKPKAKAKPKPAPEEEREESPVDEAPARHTGRDPNQNDDEDLTFSIKGNRINIDLENDDRAPDTLRSFADLVDGI
jgi:hypothetical protein